MTTPPERAGVRQAIRRWNELTATPARGRPVLIAASFTAQPLEAPLGVAMFDHDAQVPAISFAPHNQVFQVCLSPDDFGIVEGSEIVILWRIEDLFERDFQAFCNGDTKAAPAIAESAASFAGRWRRSPSGPASTSRSATARRRSASASTTSTANCWPDYAASNIRSIVLLINT